MTVLDTVLTITPKDDKTNVAVPFTLMEDADRLEITCEFSPKEIGDEALARQAALANIGRYVPRYQLPLYKEQLAGGLILVNHLTLSLDQGENYLGCAHRHAPRQTHLISQAHSSPGFTRCRPAAGSYRAVINVHSITSPQVRYHLVVRAYREGDNDV